ncbi:unnamed protein product [Urochloa decumbens]|uniref:AAA+ ATPase domain-containing protein n=1 Tax=Urochloa decumbens TaxID=240449 RepID=A0ABC9H8G7_9POAL
MVACGNWEAALLDRDVFDELRQCSISERKLGCVRTEELKMQAAISAASWVVGKALAPVTDGLLEAWAASAGLGPNVDALKVELLYVQAMLENAQGREIRGPALKELLHKLRQLAYSAEDVLDELDYFRIQDELDGTYEATDVDVRGVRKLSSCARHTVRAVGKFFPCCSSAPPDPNPFMPAPKLEFPRVEISKRMKDIVDELKPLCTKVSTILNLDLLDSNRSIVQDIAAALLTDRGHTPFFLPKNIPKSRPTTTSEISEPKFYGRHKETAKIIHDITNGSYSRNDLTVVPIAGLGGMGKTTFAQHIYKQVEKYFEAKIWICVSVSFSVGRLTKEIAESIPRVQHEESGAPEKLIEQRLKSKRLLLVLDDIWNCGDIDEWNRLLAPLRKAQTKGNIILVTTRSPAIAQMVKSKTADTIELKGLDDESFWNLFIACVFDNEESKNKLLLDIGREIVKRLKGSPLAVKTVGRILRNHLDADHWERVLKSKEWELQTGDHDIMPALKLSYDYLPFHLQQCFSFCSLFPEDYKFFAKELIHLWIGLDIIHSDGSQNKSIEDIGLQYLMDLVDYGFFKENEIDGSPFYIIHDLLHDLGLKVASHECLSMDRNNMGSMEIWPSVRHLSIIVNGADDSDGIIARNFITGLRILKKKLKIEKLRTFMVFGKTDESFTDFMSGFITKANGLRVLHLSCWCPRMEFSALTHLRYLRLGMIDNSPDTHLPCMLSRFYHLRILDLREWMGSSGLPRDMSNLTKLRHFNTRFDEHHSNIFNVGKLQLLQELKRFEVKKESSGFELNQLGSLVDLRELGIYNLRKVHTKEEAAEAQLIDKIYLHKLTMDWYNWVPTRNERDVEGVVLERLQPGKNLQELRISGHGGRSCPTWLGSNLSVKALQSLDIECVDWEALPWLGHMPVLHELTLKYMNKLKEFGPSYFGSITEQSFRNINKLELIGLIGLEQWGLGDTSHLFSQLQVLIIGNCPELLGLPFAEHICHPPTQDEEAKRHYWFPNLQTLKIFDCPKVMLLPPIPWTRTLRSAFISSVPLLEDLDYSTSPVFSKLTLEITGKHDLHSQDEVLDFGNLADLQNFKITDCPPLELKHFQMLTSLEMLTVKSDHVFVPSERVGETQCLVPVESLFIESDHATGKEVSQLLSHLPNLSRLTIFSFNREVTRLGVQVDQEQTPPHGQEQIALKLKVGGKEKIEQDGLLLLPAHLSGCLRTLVIFFFPELSLLASSLVDHYEAGDDVGGAAERGVVGGLQALRYLQELTIHACHKFLSAYKTSSSSSVSCCFPFPSSLQNLDLEGDMGTLEPLPLSNLTSLTQLQIGYCGEDFRVEGLWTLLTHGQLTNLTVFGCPKFFLDLDHLVRAVPDLEDQDQLLQLCSPKLQQLRTDDVAAILTAPICKLLSCSLTKLVLDGDQGVERFTKEQEEALQLLVSLKELGFWFHYDKLQCLPAGLHTLPSLKRIDINFCSAITSLPKDGLPISLRELKIICNGGNSEELKQHCRNFVREHPRIKLI